MWDSDDVYRSIESGDPELLDDLTNCEPIIIQPIDLQETVDALAAVLQTWIMSRPRGEDISLAIILDEAGLYSLKSWDWIIRCSPRLHTSIILTTHRPMDVWTTVRSIADRWIMFQISQEHDIDVIDKRCGSVVAEQVQTLLPYQFIVWDDAIGKATRNVNSDAWKEPRATPLTGEPIETGTPKPPQQKLW